MDHLYWVSKEYGPFPMASPLLAPLFFAELVVFLPNSDAKRSTTTVNVFVVLEVQRPSALAKAPSDARATIARRKDIVLASFCTVL